MTTETKTKALAPLEEMKQSLHKLEPQFKMALPPQIPVEKFVRVAQTAIQTNPDLLKADRTSLFAACMFAAQDGLLPNGKEAALVTFGGKVAYMPMLAGILKKVRNSGELSSITSQIVHQNDKFRYWVDGDGEHILHEPLMFGDRGDAMGVYALAKTKDGAVYIEVMDHGQVDAIRSVARSKNVWDGSFGSEMWKKSAIRRLSKRLPMSTDLEQVIQRDDDLYDLKGGDLADPPPPEAPKKTKSSRLSKIIETTAEAEVTPPTDNGATHDDTEYGDRDESIPI